MLEARITKTVVEPHNGDLYLLGVCEYYEHMVNFRVKFGIDDIREADEFFQDVREQLAMELEIPAYRVDINRDAILEKMIYWAYKFESLGIH